MKTTLRHGKAQLSRLADAALRGDEVINATAGKPCVRLVSLDLAPRQPGSAKTKAALTPAFFEPLPESELTAWDGR